MPVIAGLTALGGLLQLLAHAARSCTPGSTGSEVDLGPLWLPVAGHVVSVVVGLLLLLLADQLAKRKRRPGGWRSCCSRSARVAHVLKGPHPVALAFCVGDARRAGLATGRTSARRPTRRRCCAWCGSSRSTWPRCSRSASSRCGLERDRIDAGPHPRRPLETIFAGPGRDRRALHLPRAVLRRVLPGRAARARHRRAGRASPSCCSGRWSARDPHTEDDWAHASRLVHTYGWDTLAYFALRDDKSFFFSSDGEAMIAYTYLGGYALVVGRPDRRARVGRPRCSTSSSRCATSAPGPRRSSPSARPACRSTPSRGFSSFYLGDEAIIDCRRSPSRARRARACARRCAGSAARYTLPDDHRVGRVAAAGRAAQRDQRQVAGQGARARASRCRSVQDIAGAGANPEFLLCVALDEDGVPGGFLRVVPAYGPSFGYTLDLMRHDPDAPNGMTEFLIASTAAALRRARGARGCR